MKMKLRNEKEYKKRLAGKISKILYLYEEHNPYLHKHIESVLSEVRGLEHVFDGLDSRSEYISLRSLLEELYIECFVTDFSEQEFIRRIVFHCTYDLIEKMWEGDSNGDA